MTTHPRPRPNPDRRALRFVLVWVTAAAVLSTFVSVTGMYAFFIHNLGNTVLVAAVSAAFLEIGMIAVALLARSRMTRGENAPVTLVFTWVFALVSGLFAGLHEVLPGNGDIILNATTCFNALFRVAPPLAAAGLWHLLLIEEGRDILAGRTREQTKRDKLMLKVSELSQALRRALDLELGDETIAKLENKQRKAYMQLLKAVPATDPLLAHQLNIWMKSVGSVENFAEVTRPALPPAPPKPKPVLSYVFDGDPENLEDQVKNETEQDIMHSHSSIGGRNWIEFLTARLGPAIEADAETSLETLCRIAEDRRIETSKSAIGRWRRSYLDLTGDDTDTDRDDADDETAYALVAVK